MWVTLQHLQSYSIKSAFFTASEPRLLLSLSLLCQTMTQMLWAVPTSPTRRMRKRGALASDSLISGPRMRAPCLLPGTVASAPSCCVRNASDSGRNSSRWSGRTDCRWRKLVIIHLGYILSLFFNLNYPTCAPICSATRVLRTHAPMWTCCCPSALWYMHPKTARGSTMSSGSPCPTEMRWCWPCKAKSRPTDGSG